MELFFTFSGLVMSLIGSLLTMLVVIIFYFKASCPVDLDFYYYWSFASQTLVLPCACFLSILKGRVSRIEVSFHFLYPRSISLISLSISSVFLSTRS